MESEAKSEVVSECCGEVLLNCDTCGKDGCRFCGWDSRETGTYTCPECRARAEDF